MNKTRTRRPAPAATKGTARSVLLIEDDESVRDAIIASLESIGITRVTVARDGESGLAQIDAVHPDVVLLDLMLPGTDGFDVLAKLRQGRSGFHPERVVVISAMSDALSESALLQLGADRVLAKPFTLERLEAAVVG
ncbi:MAG: response regulator [Chloroflexi bacterium]|nr:response regulator [Chloroflexota bacterium]